MKTILGTPLGTVPAPVVVKSLVLYQINTYQMEVILDTLLDTVPPPEVVAPQKDPVKSQYP